MCCSIWYMLFIAYISAVSSLYCIFWLGTVTPSISLLWDNEGFSSLIWSCFLPGVLWSWRTVCVWCCGSGGTKQRRSGWRVATNRLWTVSGNTHASTNGCRRCDSRPHPPCWNTLQSLFNAFTCVNVLPLSAYQVEHSGDTCRGSWRIWKSSRSRLFLWERAWKWASRSVSSGSWRAST